MSPTILVSGATGTDGGETLRALQVAGADPIALVRDPARAAERVGRETRIRTGDLSDEHSLRAALQGIDRLLLCSGNDPAMLDVQLTAARAIGDSNLERVVKISGSPVSIRPNSPARSGRDHLAIEQALTGTGHESIAIRPNTFMQNFLAQAVPIGHGALPGPEGEPRVSFVDASDIGRVAAAALLADTPPEPVLEVTGPEALTWSDVAEIMTAQLGRTITHYPASPEVIRQGMLSMGRAEWFVEHTLELAALMCETRAAEVTDTVVRTTGQTPAHVSDFVARHAVELPKISE
jgi:uncharacterized protein YbjT (DUF2867 family)